MSNDNEAQVKNTLPPLAIEVPGSSSEGQGGAKEASAYTGTKPGSMILSVPDSVTEKATPGTKGS